jgi:hypothetical protein
VGDVYRVGLGLFVLAFQYRDDRFSREESEAHCKDLQKAIFFSEDETQAFRNWAREQISKAQSSGPKNPILQLRLKREQRNNNDLWFGDQMSTLSVTLIDVGWGDSLLIESRDNSDSHYALVDSNDTSSSRSSHIFLKRFFEKTRYYDSLVNAYF